MAREGSETGQAWDADAYDGDHTFVYEDGEELLGAVPESERAAVRAGAADRLRAELFEGGTWTADYRRLRFVAVRE